MKLLSLSIIILAAFIGMAGGGIAKSQGFYDGASLYSFGMITAIVAMFLYILAYLGESSDSQKKT